jgi:hypothetical protein
VHYIGLNKITITLVLESMRRCPTLMFLICEYHVICCVETWGGG